MATSKKSTYTTLQDIAKQIILRQLLLAHSQGVKISEAYRVLASEHNLQEGSLRNAIPVSLVKSERARRKLKAVNIESLLN